MIELTVRIGFEFELESAKVLREIIAEGRVERVSKPSLFGRVCDILKLNNATTVIDLLLEFGLGEYLFPELDLVRSSSVQTLTDNSRTRLRKVMELATKGELIPMGIFHTAPYVLVAIVGTTPDRLASIDTFYELGGEFDGSLQLCAESLSVESLTATSSGG